MHDHVKFCCHIADTWQAIFPIKVVGNEVVEVPHLKCCSFEFLCSHWWQMVLLLVVCQNNFHPDIQLQHSQGHSVHFNTWIVVLLPQLQHHQAHTLDLSCFASQLQSSRLLFEHCKAIEKPVSVHNSKLFIQLLHSLPYSLQIGERRQRQDVIAQHVEYASKLVLVRSQIFAVHVIQWAIQCCQPWNLKDSASWLATPKVPFMWSPNQSFPFGITCEILPGVRTIPLASTHCTRAFQNWPPWKFQRRCKIFKVAFQGHQSSIEMTCKWSSCSFSSFTQRIIYFTFPISVRKHTSQEWGERPSQNIKETVQCSIDTMLKDLFEHLVFIEGFCDKPKKKVILRSTSNPKEQVILRSKGISNPNKNINKAKIDWKNNKPKGSPHKESW